MWFSLLSLVPVLSHQMKVIWAPASTLCSLSTSSSWYVCLFIKYTGFLPTGCVLSGYVSQLPQLTPELLTLERCYLSFAHLHVLEDCLYWACKIMCTQTWKKASVAKAYTGHKKIASLASVWGKCLEQTHYAFCVYTMGLIWDVFMLKNIMYSLCTPCKVKFFWKFIFAFYHTDI